MSRIEDIQCFPKLDTEKYMGVLQTEYGAREHPKQKGSFVIGQPPLPFYHPKQSEEHPSMKEHTFILGFNGVPLSPILVQALIEHPDVVPDDSRIRWTQEQELIFDATLGDLRKEFTDTKEK